MSGPTWLEIPALGGDPLDAARRILSPELLLLYIMLLLGPEKDVLVWRFSVRIVRIVEMSVATRFSNWSSCLEFQSLFRGIIYNILKITQYFTFRSGRFSSQDLHVDLDTL